MRVQDRHEHSGSVFVRPERSDLQNFDRHCYSVHNGYKLTKEGVVCSERIGGQIQSVKSMSGLNMIQTKQPMRKERDSSVQPEERPFF